MRKFYESINENDCKSCQEVEDKLAGYPVRGQQGPGRHNVRTDPPPPGVDRWPGWTVHAKSVNPVWDTEPDPNQPLPPPDRFEYDVTDVEALVAQDDVREPEQRKLTAQERSNVASRIALAKEREPGQRRAAKAVQNLNQKGR